MVNEIPDVKPHSTYNVKETCAILNICKDTLTEKRKQGKIKPINPNNPKRYRYSGASIRKLWLIENPVTLR